MSEIIFKADRNFAKMVAEELAIIMGQPKENDFDVVTLEELSQKNNIGVRKLRDIMKESRIPKVKGSRKVAIHRKYIPELLKKAA